MSVITITKSCTLKCEYCFDVYHQQRAKQFWEGLMIIPWDFGKYLGRMWEFFQNKNNKSICISWWEPTLHPKFISFVNDALNVWFNIYLLSNLTFPNKIRKFLAPHVSSWKIKVLTNINNPDEDYCGITPQLRENVLNNLEELQNPWIRVSVNIFSADVSYDYILDVFDLYPKLDKLVRLGIQNPILPKLKEDNTYIFDKDMFAKYKQLGKVIDDLVVKLHNIWRKIYLDCGSGFCIFSPNTIQQIQVNWWEIHGCALPNDEVHTFGQYHSCYALDDYGNEDMSINITNTTLRWQRLYYMLRTEFFKSHYLVLPTCKLCKFFDKGCPRFCVSNNIYYWSKIFEKWRDFLKSADVKYTSKEMDYAYAEYLISMLQINELKKFIDSLDYEDVRVKMYKILCKFLNQETRKVCIDELNDYMENSIAKKWIQLSNLDFKLVRLVDMLIKDLKLP